MKNHRLAIRIWLTTAIATTASLAIVSGASAMRNARDPFNQGYGSVDSANVANSSSGLHWSVIGIGVTFIAAAAVVAAAVAYVGRHRTSLATSH
jgi:hypothetical protein